MLKRRDGLGFLDISAVLAHLGLVAAIEACRLNRFARLVVVTDGEDLFFGLLSAHRAGQCLYSVLCAGRLTCDLLLVFVVVCLRDNDPFRLAADAASLGAFAVGLARCLARYRFGVHMLVVYGNCLLYRLAAALAGIAALTLGLTGCLGHGLYRSYLRRVTLCVDRLKLGLAAFSAFPGP